MTWPKWHFQCFGRNIWQYLWNLQKRNQNYLHSNRHWHFTD